MSESWLWYTLGVNNQVYDYAILGSNSALWEIGTKGFTSKQICIKYLSKKWFLGSCSVLIHRHLYIHLLVEQKYEIIIMGNLDTLAQKLASLTRNEIPY